MADQRPIEYLTLAVMLVAVLLEDRLVDPMPVAGLVHLYHRRPNPYFVAEAIDHCRRIDLRCRRLSPIHHRSSFVVHCVTVQFAAVVAVVLDSIRSDWNCSVAGLVEQYPTNYSELVCSAVVVVAVAVAGVVVVAVVVESVVV